VLAKFCDIKIYERNGIIEDVVTQNVPTGEAVDQVFSQPFESESTPQKEIAAPLPDTSAEANNATDKPISKPTIVGKAAPSKANGTSTTVKRVRAF
jgi:hypothetical protein